MKIKLIKLKKMIVHTRHFYYTVIKSKPDTCNNKSLHDDNAERKEIFDMTEITKKLHNIQLPPHVIKELGLEANWHKKVSPELIEKIVLTAEKYKGALRRLSKY